MNRSVTKVLIAGLALAPSAAFAQGAPLSDVASQCGYRYSFIGAEQAVVLTRHGTTVKVRPGADLYEYNDRNVPVDGPTPYYADGDVFVSDGMVARLRKYASCDPSKRVAQITTAGGTSLGSALNPATGALNVEGPSSIQTVTAHQIPEQSQIQIDGTASPNARVAITLFAIPSHDLPEVVVSRTHIRADDKGNFSSIISTASLFYPGSLARLTAETDGGNSKSIPISLDPPNHTKDVPSDHVKE